MLDNLSTRQKVAAGLFIFGKLNSVMCAVTMFVDVRIATVLLVLAVLGVAGSIATCLIDIRRRSRLEELEATLREVKWILSLSDDRDGIALSLQHARGIAKINAILNDKGEGP